MNKKQDGKSSFRVLVLDDDLAHLQTLKAILEDEEFEVIGSTRARDALDCLEKQNVDVAVVDLRLPDLNEKGILEKIGVYAEGIPIIIHTGYASYNTAKTAINIGIFGYVEKGEDPAELIRQINRAVQTRLLYRAESLEQVVAERTKKLEAMNNELRMNEVRFSTVFHSSPVAIAITRLKDNQFIDVNLAWQKLMGFTREEVVGRTPHEFQFWVNPGDRDWMINELRTNGAVKNFTVIMRNKSGFLADILMSGELINLSGEMCLLTLAQNITEQKRAEKTLRQMVSYNRSLIEASLDPLVTIGPDGKITDVNTATEKITCHTRKELIGTDFSEYFTEPQKARAGYQQVFRDGFVKDYPLEIQCGDGNIMTVLYNATVYRDESGCVIGVFAAARDITAIKKYQEELQQSRNFLQAILDALPDNIAILDEKGTILMVNGAWRRFADDNQLGWSDYGVGKNYIHICESATGKWSEEAPMAIKGFLKVINNQTECYCLEYPCHSPDKERWFNMLITRFSLHNKIHIAFTHHDITLQRQAENTLKKNEYELRELSKNINHLREDTLLQISREIHDELGQNLTAMKIEIDRWIDMAHAQRNAEDETIRSFPQRLNECIDIIHRICSDLRPSVLDDFGLDTAIEQLIQKLSSQSKINYQLACAPLPPDIDKEIGINLYRIIQEALTNVIRHAQATTIWVQLHLQNDFIILDIIDNGIGFVPENINRDNSFGLIGMRERVYALGGKFDLDSTQGIGDQDKSDRSIEKGGDNIVKKNILIADDHPIVRSGLIKLLDTAPDIRVAGEADNCQEVLAQAQQKEYDLVVLDITMPGGGLAALKQLKTLKPNLPVLMLSVHHEDEYAIRSLKAGASGYLMKTTAQKDLLTAIRKILSEGKYISEHLVDQLADYISSKNDELPHRLLSDREYEIMCMIVNGKGLKEIALELSLSPKTISTHRTRILIKMKMKSDCELARYAIENKLLSQRE